MMRIASEASSPGEKSLAQLFYCGRSDEVLAASIDAPFAAPLAAGSWPYVIGALCFRGRVEEAELRLKKLGDTLRGEELVAARFYLGLGFARLSQYPKARRLFAENLQLLRQQKRWAAAPMDLSRTAFYVWQGIAFFRQLCGQKTLALAAGQKAWTAAIEADFFFGRMLATEIRAHSLIGCGQVALGLRELETAYHLATQLGHGAYEKAIYRSLVIYKIQFGFPPYDATQTIQELLSESRVANNYTDNALSLELTRQFMLRGQLDEAARLHEEIGRSIYAERHRRHEVFWHLQGAEIAWVRGDRSAFHRALERAESCLDPIFDLALQLHTLGLRMRDEPDSWEAACRALTRRLGADIPQRMLARTTGQPLPRARGEDPLGDILDELHAGERSLFQKLGRVLDSPYLGLMARLLPRDESPSSIEVLMPEGVLLIFDRGDVQRGEGNLSTQALDLLRLLGPHWISKEKIVEAIWGYRYHPLKHDSLVYSLISRVRAQLGKASAWLEHGAEGYRLRPGTGLRVHDFQSKPPPVSPSLPLDVPESQASLNGRQLQILEALEKQRASISVEDCVQLFGTSRVTASRDLTQLYQEGYLQRIGRGRATEYKLSSIGQPH